MAHLPLKYSDDRFVSFWLFLKKLDFLVKKTILKLNFLIIQTSEIFWTVPKDAPFYGPHHPNHLGP